MDYKIEEIDEKKYIVIENLIEGDSVGIELNCNVYTSPLSVNRHLNGEIYLLLEYDNILKRIVYKLEASIDYRTISVTREANIEELATTFVACWKEKTTIKDTVLINDIVQKMYAKWIERAIAFYNSKSAESCNLFSFKSEIPIAADIEVYNDSKLIGRGSRILYKSQLCHILDINKLKNLEGEKKALISFGYEVYELAIDHLDLNHECNGICSYLVSSLFIVSDHNRMSARKELTRRIKTCIDHDNYSAYISANNTKEDLMLFLKEREPEKIIININKYILQEYTKIKREERIDNVL